LTMTEPMLLHRTGCRCKACSTFRGPDNQLALIHNLLFYQEFGAQLRVMVRDQTMLDFLQAFTGQDYSRKIAKAGFMDAER
jgi:queuine/archaeosine tRNA-ribosyltransferase